MKQPQISLTIEDQSTGYVVAMIGGRGTKEGNLTLNRSTDAVRQPGSTFKIVSTYAPALDSAGMTLADVEVDGPFNYDNGRPVSNWYSSGYRGICSLRDGIRDSLNIVTVKEAGKNRVLPLPDYVFKADDAVMVLGLNADVDKLVRKL